MAEFGFGVDIGGTTIKMGLFSVSGTLIEKWEITTRKDDGGKYILSDVAQSIDYKMQEKKIPKYNCAGIGVGVPGPVKDDGTVMKCVNLGWGVFNVSHELRKMVDMHVRVGNDANVAAFGEQWQGSGKGYQNMVMVTLGTGVGGGIIIHGGIISGTNGAGGEIGHIKVNDAETDTCGCGKTGCLEQYSSATGIAKAAKKALNMTDQPSRLRELKYISAKDIYNAAKTGDELALALVDEAGRNLGLALSHIACVVDPELFVIGGGVSKAGDILLDTVRKHYQKNAFHASRDAKFELAVLGNDAGIYGAAALILK